jgi:nicotinate-nucleotide adenylyltransferase
VKSPAFAGLPPHGRHQRIGLFGGSFNPPHEGHRAASLVALRRLDLDWVWWLVTPGNPLKDTRQLPPIAARMAAAQAAAAHPRIAITGIEGRLGSPYTHDLVKTLTERCREVQFVWIMGADSFATFHRWKRWTDIAATLPLAIVDRPGFTVRASRAATSLAPYRVSEAHARMLASLPPPAFAFLHGPRSPLSSTRLREGANDLSAGRDPTTSLSP